MHRSPLIPRKLLRLVLPRRIRDEVLGDLEERFARHRGRPLGARLDYWRAALACLSRLPAERLLGGLRADTPLLRSLARDTSTPSPRRVVSMDSLLQDLRYAIRTLLRAPAFTGIAILTLALAVGANTALFSVLHAVVLTPLPYEEPDELILVWGALTAREVERFNSSFPMLQVIEDTADAFERVGGVVTSPMGMAAEGQEPERVDVAWVTWNLLPLLGVEPVLGRAFRERDGAPGGEQVNLVNQQISAPRVALLAHEVWQSRFGGAPEAIGSSVRLDGRPVEIVGVLPQGFHLLFAPEANVVERPSLYVALRPDYGSAPTDNVMLDLVGRLRDGASLAEARADLEHATEQILALSQGIRTAGFELRMARMADDLTARSRPALIALMGAVGFVLLIACANVSTLLLVRATGRWREMAIRSALGGGRRRLMRQLITESLVLGMAGGALGVMLAFVGLDALLLLRPADLPRAAEVALEPTVLAFSLAASLGAAVLFGTLPALQASRPHVGDALRSRAAAGDRRQQWTRSTVVVAQVALSVVLLVGAGLMVRSFLHLHRVDPGFDADGVLTFLADIPAARYPDHDERHRLLIELHDRLAAIPGVTAVGGATPLPLRDGVFWGPYGTEDALADPSLLRQGNYRLLLPGYLEAIGARLLAGRPLDRADYQDAARVVMVDERLAERLWPGESALGKQLYVRPVTPQPMAMEVVGVVGHEHTSSLAAPGPDNVYIVGSVTALDFAERWIVRTDSDRPEELIGAIRNAVAEIDPLLPVAEAATLHQVVDDALGGTRAALALVGLFGAMALVMAAVGLYGVLAYSVRQRGVEMGIRMALGARSTEIRGLVVRQGMQLAIAGIVLGLVAALALTRSASTLFVGVSPADPLTYAGIGLLFLAVAAAAAWIPAHRATRVDVLRALAAD